MRFSDQKIKNDNEAISFIIKNLSSSKKIISQNYTRNNFEILKRKYPLFWNYVNGKTFSIFNKHVAFIENINYGKIIYINNKPLKIFKKSTQIQDFLINIYSHKQITFLELCEKVITKKISGVNLLLFAKQYYADDYHFIMQNFHENGQSNRETIFRYIHNLKIRPKINNIPLKFLTYNDGYLSWRLYLEYSKLSESEMKDEYKILEIFLNKLNYGKHTKTNLRYFFNDLYNKINQKYNAKYFNTKVWLYFFNYSDFPKCPICQSPLKEKNNFSWSIYCSLSCRSKALSIENLKRAISLYGDKWETKWIIYKKTVEKLSEYSYKKYKHIINPNNFKRRKGEYHLDHIIPKLYGFLYKIDPYLLSHYKNLQILSEHDNESKGAKILIDDVDSYISYIKCELNKNNYFKERGKND